MTDWATVEDLLNHIDSKIQGASQGNADIEFELQEVTGLRDAFEGIRKELYGVRSCGLPKFVSKDYVRDTFLGRTFYVSRAIVMEGEKGMEWHYLYGAYYIPESDIEIIHPRS